MIHLNAIELLYNDWARALEDKAEIIDAWLSNW